jgi:hypothetical protein
LVEHFLPLADHAQHAVVQVDDLDRQTVLLAGRQLLDVHLDRTLAGDAGNRHIRIGHQDAHAVRQADAHGAQTAGVDPAARLVELVVLGGKHLVLADVRGDEGIAPGHFVELLDHVLRHDQVSDPACSAGCRGARHSSICFHQSAQRSGSALKRHAGSQLEHFVQHVGDVADDGHIDLDRLEIDDGSMSMWMTCALSSQKCSGLPITRSSKRAPTARITSA